MLKTKTKIKNIFFDLDGTLIDSSKDVCAILKQAFFHNKIEINKDAKIIVGPPLPQMVLMLNDSISTEQQNKIIEDFRSLYAESDLQETKPYPHIIEMLKELKRMGINVFIATYKPQNLANKILSRDFDGLYADVITPSEISNFDNGKNKADILRFLIKKWDINPTESVMVGDSPSDIFAAAATNIRSVGVCYGYCEKFEISSADDIINTTEELHNFVIKLCGKESVNNE